MQEDISSQQPGAERSATPQQASAELSWSPADRSQPATATPAIQRGSAPTGAAPARPRPAPASAAGPLARWLTAVIAFALTVYLALSGGAYDIVLRSEVGVIIWWLVLLGALLGIAPRQAPTRAGWLALGCFAAFLVWTWIGLHWSASHEITRQEVCRLATYLGVVVLVLAVVAGHTGRELLAGLAAAIALVAGIAVCSKLVPSLYPTDTAARFYLTARLSYPFDYADAVGEFAALGVPLLLYFATGARSLAGRAAAAAGVPLTLLCLAMTVSRGGMLALAVGVIAFFLLVPDRIGRLPVTALVAAAGAVLLAAVVARPTLRDSAAVAPASERHSMIAIIVVTLLATAALSVALHRFARGWQRPGWTRSTPTAARRGGGALAVAVLALIVVGFAAGTFSHLWHDFKAPNPVSQSDQYFRLFSLAGSHRYQYWQIALDAFRSQPLHGLGAGGFRFYWAQRETLDEYVVNAHSLWIETLAETGIVGALALVGFFLTVLVRGARRALRSARPAVVDEQRALIAGATATVAAFCAAAAFDWVWQIGVISFVALAVCGVILGAEQPSALVAASGPRPAEQPQPERSWAARGGLAAASLVALWLIVVPLATTLEVRRSQTAARDGNVVQALRYANDAHAIQPSAASPLLQRALLLEQLGEIAAANQAIHAAIAREPLNADLWWIASRIAIEADRPQDAVNYVRRAKQLDPFFPNA